MHGQRHESSRGEASREMLVRRMAAGDQSAMAEFYDQTSPLVYGLALRILADPGAAEEVVLDVYAQVWRQAAGFDASRGTPSAWLLTLTRSRAIDQRRARRRDPATEPLESAGDVSAPTPGPEALSVAAERHRFVQQALGRLSGELREVIHLAYFNGLSHTEIANQLGHPLGTVKTRIRSAMMQLRDALAPLNAPPPALKEDRS
jgi:RNA polymerase sigma-70 factor (ECF subfamily)